MYWCSVFQVLSLPKALLLSIWHMKHIFSKLIVRGIECWLLLIQTTNGRKGKRLFSYLSNLSTHFWNLSVFILKVQFWMEPDHLCYSNSQNRLEKPYKQPQFCLSGRSLHWQTQSCGLGSPNTCRGRCHTSF